MDEERWATIPGWPAYEVSTWGAVRRATPYRSTAVGRRLTPYLLKGYPAVAVRAPGVHKQITVHRLVALTFIGPRPDGMEVNHKDGVKTNNLLDNLEYVTCSGNAQHAVAHGLGGTRAERGARLRAWMAANPKPVVPPEHRRRGDQHPSHQRPEIIRRGSQQGQAKLTEAQAAEIRQLAQTQPLKVLAERYGVSISLISQIKRGTIWRHVP